LLNQFLPSIYPGVNHPFGRPIYICCTARRDFLPSKVYTIMAAGRPLVAAVDEGSDTWQFVQEVGCGLLVLPEEPEALARAILTLYQDRAMGRALGAKGRERVEQHFTPQAAARQYAELLEQVVTE
jgi:colanic acid biosynthesis glycosyl transferase WcaI